MNLTGSPITLETKGGRVSILRNDHGVPEISGKRYEDAYYGMGWVHAHDRQLQALLTRLLLQGRAAETLAGDPALVEIGLVVHVYTVNAPWQFSVLNFFGADGFFSDRCDLLMEYYGRKPAAAAVDILEKFKY